MTNLLSEMQIQVRWSELDAYGILYHACYLHYMTEARAAYLVPRIDPNNPWEFIPG